MKSKLGKNRENYQQKLSTKSGKIGTFT